MIQGFTDSEIAKALENSPVKDNERYANKIIEKAKDKMQEDQYDPPKMEGHSTIT